MNLQLPLPLPLLSHTIRAYYKNNGLPITYQKTLQIISNIKRILLNIRRDTFYQLYDAYDKQP